MSNIQFILDVATNRVLSWSHFDRRTRYYKSVPRFQILHFMYTIPSRTF